MLFTVRRLLSSVLVLLASSFIVFFFCALQFDPLARFRASNPPKTPAFFAEQRRVLGLDQPVIVRYWKWLTHLIRFDFHSVAFIRFNFGNDINNASVSGALGTRLGVTSKMVIVAILVAVIIAIVFGVISGVRHDKPIDVVVTILTFILIALPTFWFAAVIKEVAIQSNNHLGTSFYTIGNISPGLNTYGTKSEIRKDQLLHIILPTVSLALLTTSGWIRYQRAATIDVLEADYMRLARAKGVRWPVVVRRHGLRNALIPLTTIVAIDVGALFGGAIITEKVYVWHGMGEYLNNAIGSQDVNAVVGWVMVSAVFVVLFNFLADLLYAALDPRIRLQ